MDAWVDRSPHKSAFVSVGGVKLHYLDWGGRGDTLLLLNGWGDTAHVFDDIAPQLTAHFRVLAFTRRGYGKSARPAAGYDPLTLVEDIRQFLNALGIKQAHLAGHSAAGGLMTLFAAQSPNRVLRLVYMDAAFDFTTPLRESADNHFPKVFPSSPSKRDLASVTAYRQFRQWFFIGGKPAKHFWTGALEANLRDSIQQRADGSVQEITPGETDDDLLGQFTKGWKNLVLDYAKVKSPALALMCFWDWSDYLLPGADRTAREQVSQYQVRFSAPYQRWNLEKFRKEMRHGRIVEMPDTNHYCFVQRRDQVLYEMSQFLLSR